jgi:hemerythrin-like metal-binding protein
VPFINNLKNTNPSPDIVWETVQCILSHLRSHLSAEENLMEMIAFPKAEEHKTQHKNILDMLAGEMSVLREKDNDKIRRFVKSYRHIAFTHISVYDREYVNFIENLMSARKKFNISSVRPEVKAG